VAEADTAQLRLESDAEAVQVLTVHRSKGLEFPVVYCLQLWRDPAGPDHPAYLTYHDPAAGGQRTLDLAQPPDPERVALADLEARAEQLRLAYVALTRARHRVSVVWGAFRHAQRSPLAVLLHLGADVQAAPRPPLTPAPDLADAAVRAVDGRTDAELLADLRALAAGSAGTVAVRELTLEPATALARAGSRLDPPVARPRRAVRRILGRGSFSAWVAAAGAGEGPGDEALEVLGEPLAGPERSDPAPGAALGLPGGTRTGLALHAILEQVDLADLDHPPVRAVIDAALARHGLAAAGSGDAVERLVRAVARIPLGDGAARFRLGEVPRGRRVAEPRFVAATGPGAGRGQDPAALAELLRRPDAPVPPGYADRVAALGFEVPTGFLVGALDLLLEHQGRYWVVDWKSNDLGPAAEDYAPGALARAMADHHYLLQAHLYLVALHRHLASRLPGYRYADHVAGAAFVFLRGLPDDPAPGAAVHVVQPPADLIAALSGRLGRGAAVRA
jgi:exodeoxyribonuclease V beta subunit